MRPTSGMNHYLRGKLPECFLSSPFVRRHEPGIDFTKRQPYANILTNKLLSLNMSSEKVQTRVHSALTSMNMAIMMQENYP